MNLKSYFAGRNYREDMDELLSSLDRFIKTDTFFKEQKLEKLLAKKVLLALIEHSFRRAVLGATSMDLQLTLILAGEGALEVLVVVSFTAGRIILKRIVKGIAPQEVLLLPA